MKEKIGICVAIIFILTAVGNVSGDDLSIISISPQEKTVPAGSTFTLNINITPAEPISAAACNVTFNPSILQALDVSNGGMFDGWWDDVVPGGLIQINNTAGKISYIAATSSYNVTEEGTFAIITFQAISTGVSYVNIEDATIHGKSPPDIIVVNGSVTVIAGDITPPAITLEDYPPSVINYRNVHFEWNATDDTTPYQNILFSYKLDGYDAGWSAWGYTKQKDYYNLNAGSYTFRIRAKDEAGNIGYLNYSFTVFDNSPPVITNVAVNPSQQIENGYVNITCDITDDFGIDLAKAIILYPDSIIHEFDMHHSSYYLNQTYSMIGVYYFYIYAEDVNGNSANSLTYQFEIIPADTTPPAITLEDYPPSVINYRDVHFEWNATDDTTPYQNILFSYKLDGYDAGWSAWGYTKQKDYYNLNAGSYTFRIRAKDEAGNRGYLNYSFTVFDNSPPVITNVAVNPSQQIENGYVNITCDITDDFGIDLAKAIIQYPDSTIHEFDMHHSSYYLNQTYSMAGIYYFYIYATDVNGNLANSPTQQFEIIPPDITPPVITLEDYPPSVINYRDVHFEWNATDDTTPYQNILFSYKLDGYDAGWSAWGYTKQKDYYNLNAGSYTFRIRAKDEAGNIGYLNYSFNIVDNTPPVITNVAVNPAQNLINGYINITCNITDDFGIDLAKAIIQYPDSTIHEFDMHHSSYYLNQTYSMAGIYYFYIYARDIYDNDASSPTFQFEIIDEILPVITDVAVNPSTQDVGKNVTFSCIVTDNVEVEDVFLNISYPDGSYLNISIKQNKTGDTYYSSMAFNVMGTYEFFIYAIDTSGNSNISSTLQFEITDLSPPEITDINANPSIQDIGKEVNISCIVTDNVEVEDVFLNISYPDGSYLNISIKQNKTGDTYYSSMAFNVMGTYEFFIYAIDTSGNSNISSTLQFEITDLSPPDVEVIYPTGNESLRNGVLIQWNATDNSNTILITIKYSPNNGATWHKIVENTENDGEYEWNTSGIEDGKNYLIEISAMDAGGNIGKDYSNKFTIDNTEPTLEITKPVIGRLYMFDRQIIPLIGNKAVIVGKITIEAEADDATSGIGKVEFYIDGKYKKEDTSSPYSWVWDERIFGKHTIKVIAYDKAGNKISKELEVFIVNFL